MGRHQPWCLGYLSFIHIKRGCTRNSINGLPWAFQRGSSMICAVICGRQMSSHTPVTRDPSPGALLLWGWWDHDKGLASTGLAPLPESSAMWKPTAAFLFPGACWVTGPKEREQEVTVPVLGQVAPWEGPLSIQILSLMYVMINVLNLLGTLGGAWWETVPLAHLKIVLEDTGDPWGFAGYSLWESCSACCFSSGFSQKYFLSSFLHLYTFCLTTVLFSLKVFQFKSFGFLRFTLETAP